MRIPASGRRPKLMFLITEDWYFWSHRLSLALAAQSTGFDVLVATHVDRHGKDIQAAGLRLLPLSITRSARHPLRDLITCWHLLKIYRSERPDIVHHVALKPVVLGSLAAACCRSPMVVNALTGLGSVFIAKSGRLRILRLFLRWLLRALLRWKQSWTILQNADDMRYLSTLDIIDPRRTALIRGSGVELSRFTPSTEPPEPPTVILPARMLFDKGVAEFISAARKLRQEGVAARFILVGGIDTENPSAIPEAQVREWQRQGIIEWCGHQDDMPQVYAGCHIVCLPSYREGLPKALLEAAACGRPIVATDVPGCREIVRPGENGFLVPVKDPDALADALRTLIQDKELRLRMGRLGREIVEAEFSVERVNAETLKLYEEILANA